jgi:hypothetical protein
MPLHRARPVLKIAHGAIIPIHARDVLILNLGQMNLASVRKLSVELGLSGIRRQNPVSSAQQPVKNAIQRLQIVLSVPRMPINASSQK